MNAEVINDELSTSAVVETARYLRFRIADELCAVQVSNIERVLEVVPIMPVPGSAPYLRGVINMMGRVVPVIDLKTRFGLGTTENTVDTCIVVFELTVNGTKSAVGALADAVDEVIEIDSDSIEPTPRIGSLGDRKYISGIGKYEDQFLLILDLEEAMRDSDPGELPKPAEG